MNGGLHKNNNNVNNNDHFHGNNFNNNNDYYADITDLDTSADIIAPHFHHNQKTKQWDSAHSQSSRTNNYMNNNNYYNNNNIYYKFIIKILLFNTPLISILNGSQIRKYT